MSIPRALSAGTALDEAFASEDAFRAWYERALPRVYGYLLPRCNGARELAEEITQQAFVEAVRQRDRFRGEADPVTWVIGIARNRLADHYRRLERAERSRLRLVVGELPVRRDEVAWDRHEDRDRILAALRAMPAIERMAFVLKHVDGLTVAEIAALVGRSVKATESLLSRSRERFRGLYGDEHDG